MGWFWDPMLKNLGMGRNLPQTDKFFNESLLLPLNHVLTDEQIDFVCDLLSEYFGGRANG